MGAFHHEPSGNSASAFVQSQDAPPNAFAGMPQA